MLDSLSVPQGALGSGHLNELVSGNSTEFLGVTQVYCIPDPFVGGLRVEPLVLLALWLERWLAWMPDGSLSTVGIPGGREVG